MFMLWFDCPQPFLWIRVSTKCYGAFDPCSLFVVDYTELGRRAGAYQQREEVGGGQQT